MRIRSIRLAIAFCLTVLGAVGCAVQAVDSGEDALEAAPPEQLGTAEDAVKLETPAEQAAIPDDDFGNTCYTTTCTPGPQGNQYCTAICGDVAKCFPGGPGGEYQCGWQPCCIMM